MKKRWQIKDIALKGTKEELTNMSPIIRQQRRLDKNETMSISKGNPA
jgi:hypothetical protein